MTILASIIAVISSGTVTGMITWFLSRRKYSVEVQSTEIDSLQKAVTIWRQTAEYQSTQIVNLRTEVDALRAEIRNVEKLYTEKHAEKCRTCKYKKRYENEQSGN